MTLSKFESVFSKKMKETNETPKAIQKLLNSDAPKGFSYEKVKGREEYLLVPKGTKPSSIIPNFRINFPFVFEGIEITNQNELSEAIYRTQKPLVLDNNIQNDPPLIKSLGGDIKISNVKIFPQSGFPEIKPYEIIMGETKIIIPVERVPFNDLEIIKIKSKVGQLIKLELLYNEKKNSFKLSAKIDFSNFKYLNEYFDNLSIIESYYCKGFNFYGNIIQPNERHKKIFELNFKYFKTLKKIQEIFDEKFEFPDEILDDDIYYSKILYASFLKNSIVSEQDSETVSFVFEKEKLDLYDQSIFEGEKMQVLLPTEMTLTIFGTTFKFIQVKFYDALKIKQIISGEKENKIIFLNESKQKNVYIKYIRNSFENLDMDELREYFVNNIEESVKIDEIDFD
ncbi:abortive infection system toxin AbiGii family protein [Streptococcus parauberis]|uniref:abortive infection system toxin AbiGii family protein n=1 Tax=Streptococcus parauberis TaxID=1348 RepID=UPI000789BCC4|nr:abortive infection system toxin AbiGii family protein [Streptococcus parauberis]KYP19816.1 hypothetical protein TN39_01121 [Streptococcus parauberis]KYP19912.1 hypothetical protein AKL14_00716 [Streptococcus parauberis]KYP22769.1 hypothetical protein AKL13_00092 [Streptococcus parauberis]KYP24073.1 hypothetical protein TP84_01804 [Streptococcus parauberis]KYP25279.1 hypothetical protein TM50_01496 [Streptococcus parauberis]